MKFIGAMLTTLLGLFLFGLAWSAPKVYAYDFTNWQMAFIVISGAGMLIVGVGLAVFGIWWGNKK